MAKIAQNGQNSSNTPPLRGGVQRPPKMSDSQKRAFFSPTNIVLFGPPWMQNQGVPLGSACPIRAIWGSFSPQILFFLAYFGPNWTPLKYPPPHGGGPKNPLLTYIPPLLGGGIYHLNVLTAILNPS